MTPEQRAEHLKHAMDMATANDTMAEEGESRVNILTQLSLVNYFSNEIGY
jgi:hypothetical protein